MKYLKRFNESNSTYGKYDVTDTNIRNEYHINYTNVISLDEYYDILHELILEETTFINLYRGVLVDIKYLNSFVSNPGIRGHDGIETVQLFTFTEGGYENRHNNVHSYDNELTFSSPIVDKIVLMPREGDIIIDSDILSRIVRKLKSYKTVTNVDVVKEGDNTRLIIQYNQNTTATLI